MAGLQRSEVSFRRQGSSGLVWDDKFLAGALSQAKSNDQQDEKEQLQQEEKTDGTGGEPAKASSQSPEAPPPVHTAMERSRSNGGQAYKTIQVAPAADPPSPKVSGCGFCSAFGKPAKKPSHHRPKPAESPCSWGFLP